MLGLMPVAWLIVSYVTGSPVSRLRSAISSRILNCSLPIPTILSQSATNVNREYARFSKLPIDMILNLVYNILIVRN